MSATPTVRSGGHVQTEEAGIHHEHESRSLVLDVLKNMVRKAIADATAAKSPADSPDSGAPLKRSQAQRSYNTHSFSLSPVELVEQIVTILKQSTIVRAEQDVRSRFWKLYKTEAEEFHIDFIEKYGGELDLSLIFAGLFSAVSATFATALQPNLSADPNATTQVLLMMVVRSLNSTAFAGQDLVLPHFTGPDRTTIWVQSLLYASLGASLFAALAAMLGKEWLSYYARVGERGTIEDRCIDRQRKLIAMRAWRFDMVLACIPLLLQGSLLLFGIALSAYMWSQQRTIAGVIVAANVVGVLFYGVLFVCSLVFPDCPYHIPLTDLTLAACDRSLPQVLRLVSSILRMVLRIFPERQSREILPVAAPAILETSVIAVEPDVVLQLDAPCVEWLLMTSTDPDALVAAARMALEVDLSQVEFSLKPVQQLEKIFRSCFVSPDSSRSGAYELLPANYERATAYGQALLGIHLDRHLTYSPTKLLFHYQEPPDFGWLRATPSFIQDHPDSRFICEALSVLFPSEDMDEYDRFQLVPEVYAPPLIPPQSSIIDWFSYRILHCIYNLKPEDESQTWMRHYFVTLMLQWFRSGQLTTKARANCSLACAMLVGCRVSLDRLAAANKSAIAAPYAVAAFQRLYISPSNTSWRVTLNALLLTSSTHLQLQFGATDYGLGHSLTVVREVLNIYSVVSAFVAAWNPVPLDHTIFTEGGVSILSKAVRSVVSNMTGAKLGFTGSTEHTHASRDKWHSHLMSRMWRPWSAERTVHSTVLIQDDDSLATVDVNGLNVDDVAGLVTAIQVFQELSNSLGTEDTRRRSYEDLLVSCSFLLSEVPDYHTKMYRLNTSFYDTLSFLASHATPVLRNTGLKIIRNLCGCTETEVDQKCLEGFVGSMGGIDKFCEALSFCAPEMRRPLDNDDSDHIIESTHAYLNIIAGLSLQRTWLEHVRHRYAPKLLSLADNMMSDSHGNIDRVLIWRVRWNTWRSLVQVLFQCEEHEPGFIRNLPSKSTENEAELVRAIACTPWDVRFSEPYPLPDSCIPAMMNFTIDTWRQQQLEGLVMMQFIYLSSGLTKRMEDGVGNRQSAAMLAAARKVLRELRDLRVRAGVEDPFDKEDDTDLAKEANAGNREENDVEEAEEGMGPEEQAAQEGRRYDIDPLNKTRPPLYAEDTKAEADT
ncbi:hypothetical protein EUX98_g3512 [Antrodiella citrinella]|uniref:DUF6535 domain-containing protein n=1 Tax=Antrodiella citrinella TaxID=2447956 RepID=A0A4S4N4F8_9APHY|nr:hypothetical protein EUX98_g3512 [Antrodiella citrinella]